MNESSRPYAWRLSRIGAKVIFFRLINRLYINLFFNRKVTNIDNLRWLFNKMLNELKIIIIIYFVQRTSYTCQSFLNEFIWKKSENSKYDVRIYDRIISYTTWCITLRITSALLCPFIDLFAFTTDRDLDLRLKFRPRIETYTHNTDFIVLKRAFFRCAAPISLFANDRRSLLPY